jgi:transposase
MKMTFFETANPRKVKTGPVIKRLLVRCPSTAKLTATGQTIEEQLWERAKVKTPKFTCPHCSQVHSWTKKDVVLAR